MLEAMVGYPIDDGKKERAASAEPVGIHHRYMAILSQDPSLQLFI